MLPTCTFDAPERAEMSRLPRAGACSAPGQLDVLIQQVAFGLAAAGDEHAIERLAAAGPRHFGPALAVAVDVEAHDRIELRQRLAIDVQAKPLAGEAHVVGAPDRIHARAASSASTATRDRRQATTSSQTLTPGSRRANAAASDRRTDRRDRRRTTR